MALVGCDLHARKQPVAVLDTTTGEVLEQELGHDGDAVERFYRSLRPPVTIGIETTGYTQWFHALRHRLGHTVRVGEASKIRAMVVRKAKPDRRDARHLLDPLRHDRFPTAHLARLDHEMLVVGITELAKACAKASLNVMLHRTPMRATFAGGCGSTASGAAKATEIAPHWNARRFSITASKPTGGTRRRYGGTSRKSNRGDGGPAVLIELVGGRSIAHASAFISPQREPSSQIASLEWEGRDLCAAINLERDGH